jgi:hypothetical protein
MDRDAASRHAPTLLCAPTTLVCAGVGGQCDSVSQLSRQAQDALGVPADAQQLVFRGAVLEQHDTLAALHLADGSTLQMVVGRRRPKEAEMSPGGTWRV